MYSVIIITYYSRITTGVMRNPKVDLSNFKKVNLHKSYKLKLLKSTYDNGNSFEKLTKLNNFNGIDLRSYSANSAKHQQ